MYIAICQQHQALSSKWKCGVKKNDFIKWLSLIWVSNAWSPGEAAASSRDARQRPRRPPVTHGQVGASHLWTLSTNFAFCILDIFLGFTIWKILTLRPLVTHRQVGWVHADSFWKRYLDNCGRGYFLQRFFFGWRFSHWNVDKPAMFGYFWSKTDHFWTIPIYEDPKVKKRLITRSPICGLLAEPKNAPFGT